jgi:hypothetical protein
MMRYGAMFKVVLSLALGVPAPLVGQHLASFWYQPHPLPAVEDASDRLRFLVPHFSPVIVEGNRFTPQGGYTVARADVNKSGAVLVFRRSGAGQPSEFHWSWSSRYNASAYAPDSDGLAVSIAYGEIGYFQIWTVPTDRGPDAWCVVPAHARTDRNEILCVDSVHNAQVLVDALATLVLASGARLNPPIGMWAVSSQQLNRGKHVRQSGCQISQLDWNGPPAEAGVEIGDVLYAVNGNPCAGGGDFLGNFRQSAGSALEGGELHVDLFRRGKHLGLKLSYPESETHASPLPQESSAQPETVEPAAAPVPAPTPIPASTPVPAASSAQRPIPPPASLPLPAVAVLAPQPLPAPVPSAPAPLPVPVPVRSEPSAPAPLPTPVPARSQPDALPLPAAGPAGFRLGVQVRVLTDADVAAFKLSVHKGLMVVRVEKGSMAEAMQIQAGDVLLEVNGTEIADLQVFVQAIQSGGAKTFRIWHNGQSMLVFIPLSL